jgi:chaperone required for assembly of F1-ATPase
MADQSDPIEPENPVVAARRGARQPLQRRFYRNAEAATAADGHIVVLDGTAVLTPARRRLAAPTLALAGAIAAEWQAQGDLIKPAQMPLTRLANAIIDGVADAARPVAAEIKKYLGSDLLFYRAATPDDLRVRQARHWDPVLAWARDSLGASFKLGEGVVHVSQPRDALEAAGAAIPKDPWRLGALHAVTTLTGSALIALALSRGTLSADAAWQAAHVDGDWNMEQWGRDDMALARRASRFAEFQAAVTVLGALPG